MSQWVPNPKSLTSSQEGGSENDSPSEMGHSSTAANAGSDGSARFPWWAKVFPYCLSALFYLSAFLIIFSPLPLLFFHIQKGRKWGWLAAGINFAIVAVLGGWISSVFYFVWIVTPALLLPEFLKKRKSLEVSVVYTLLGMIICGALVIAGYSQIHHLNPVHEIQGQISHFVDYLGQSMSANSSLINPGDIDEWKKNLLLEFPSAVAIFSLILVWANLILVLRANPNQMRESLGLDPTFLKRWKAPEFLVWPTIFTGFFLVVDLGIYSDIALNVFKVLMSIYTIQGLSILSYLFDLWGIKGFFRFVGYSLSLLLMMPLVLSLGFFDLWFDFRGKFRQS